MRYSILCSKLSTFGLLLFILSSFSSAQEQIQRQNSNIETTTAAQDATYIIKQGDTLWDLAFRFLSDPFKWPQIWSVNPYISNPDLIFPGNSLMIPAKEGRHTVSNGISEQPLTTGPVSQTIGVLEQGESLKSDAARSSGQAGDSLILSSLRSKHLLSAGFFASVPFLWTEQVPAGNAVVDKPPVNVSYQLFDKFFITPQEDASYSTGDTVDIYKSLRMVKFQNSRANLIKRTGRARIINIEQKKISAELFEMSDPIKGNEFVSPAKQTITRTIDTIVDPDIVIEAEIFERAENTKEPYLFQTLIIDRGSSDGIKLGDVFAVYHLEKQKNIAALSVTGFIAHVERKSSSMVIITMSNENLGPGDKAILIRRSVFSEGDN